MNGTLNVDVSHRIGDNPLEARQTRSNHCHHIECIRHQSQKALDAAVGMY
jgi:hypothetical protein